MHHAADFFLFLNIPLSPQLTRRPLGSGVPFKQCLLSTAAGGYGILSQYLSCTRSANLSQFNYGAKIVTASCSLTTF